MNHQWDGLIKTEGRWVKYLVSFKTCEVIAFSHPTPYEKKAISSIYKNYCRSLVVISGIDALAAESHVELCCGNISASLHAPSRNALDAILRRFKASGEDYQFHVYLL